MLKYLKSNIVNMDSLLPNEIIRHVYKMLHVMNMKRVNNEYKCKQMCELHEERNCQEECYLGIFIDGHLYNWRLPAGNPSCQYIYNKKGNTHIYTSKRHWYSLLY